MTGCKGEVGVRPRTVVAVKTSHTTKMLSGVHILTRAKGARDLTSPLATCRGINAQHDFSGVCGGEEAKGAAARIMHRRSGIRRVGTTKMKISGGLLGKRVVLLSVSSCYSEQGGSHLVVPAAPRRKSDKPTREARGIETPAGATLGEGEIATAVMSEIVAGIQTEHAVIACRRGDGSGLHVYRLDGTSVPGPTCRENPRDHSDDHDATAQDDKSRFEKPELFGATQSEVVTTTERRVPGAPSGWFVDSSGSEARMASTSAHPERAAGVECAPGKQHLIGPTVRLERVRRY